MSISEDSVPPFKAWRLTPKRQASPVQIVSTERWGNRTVFVTSRRGTLYAGDLWSAIRWTSAIVGLTFLTIVLLGPAIGGLITQ